MDSIQSILLLVFAMLACLDVDLKLAVNDTKMQVVLTLTILVFFLSRGITVLQQFKRLPTSNRGPIRTVRHSNLPTPDHITRDSPFRRVDYPQWTRYDFVHHRPRNSAKPGTVIRADIAELCSSLESISLN